jgi:hypothetical protein
LILSVGGSKIIYMFEEVLYTATPLGDGPVVADDVVWLPDEGWVSLEPYVRVPGVLPDDVERVPAGPELAAELARFDVDSADGWNLVEAAALVERLAAWVAAKQAAVLAALVARPELQPTAETGYRSVNSITNTAVEVAGRCQLTAKQAEGLVGHAFQLVEDFPDTWAALEAGLIDLRRVRAITDELGGQEDHVRRRVEAAVLPRAPLMDSVALRKLIKQLLHELAPVEAAERHAIARDSRYVAVTPASDGMAHLEARLPAEDAAALDAALNVAAADLKRADAAAGEPVRSKDQRRADALAELGWAALAACTDSTTQSAAARHTGAAGAAAGHDRTAANDASHGGAAGGPPGHADRSVSRGLAGRVGHLTVGSAGGAAGTAMGRSPGDFTVGSAGGAAGRPPDHRTGAAGGLPGSPSAGPPGGPVDADPGGSATPTRPAGGAAPRRRPISVHVTIPFGSLAGLSDKPGELEGYGPIPAQVARTLAAEGVWTWLTTDPGTGQLLDLGRTKYRPSKALADFVAARDQTCRMPGCHRPARACDIDHIKRFASGGTTCAANCHSLCETHHLLKHHGRWQVSRQPDGTTRWRSPTGHTYERPPERIGPSQAAAGRGLLRLSSQRSAAVQAPENSR